MAAATPAACTACGKGATFCMRLVREAAGVCCSSCSHYDGRADAQREVEGRLRAAVNAACTCGGNGPGEGCPACEVWHAVTLEGAK